MTSLSHPSSAGRGGGGPLSQETQGYRCVCIKMDGLREELFVSEHISILSAVIHHLIQAMHCDLMRGFVNPLTTSYKRALYVNITAVFHYIVEAKIKETS